MMLMHRYFCSIILLLGTSLGYKLPIPTSQVLQSAFSKAASSAFIGASLFTLGILAPQPIQLNSYVAYAKTATSVFEGQYDDPNHPGCLRKITVKNNLVTIVGSDEVDGSNQWIIRAKEDFPGTIFVDFSPKGGPANLLG